MSEVWVSESLDLIGKDFGVIVLAKFPALGFVFRMILRQVTV